MINGYATSTGTAEWAERHSQLSFRPLGQTGLLVSQAGFGSYRISGAVPEHAAALRRALDAGVNLIDTSANYADGGSEELIGEVIAQLITSGRLRREEILLVSKGGYLQGQNYKISQERKRRGTPFPELVPYADGLEHCIHPEFLTDQLSRSLARLGLETIDVYLLHNPEYFFGRVLKERPPSDRSRAEYERRIENAFRHLETEVAKGRIRWYGISSNTFPVSHEDPQYTCLERIWQKAESISSDHHFRVIQLPMNLFESGAVLFANQPSGKTTLAVARQKDIGVLINRPLNAFTGNRLVRLADVKDQIRVPIEEIQRRIGALREAEKVFVRQILPALNLEPAIRSQLEVQLLSADALDRSWDTLQGYDHWRQVRDEALLPKVRGALAYIETRPAAGRQATEWLGSYRESLEAIMQAIGGVHAEEARQRVARIKTMLAAVDPHWAAKASLSRLAIRALRSTAGVSCVLVGMRREKYAEEVVSELQMPVSVLDRESAWTQLQEEISTIV